MTYQGGKTSPGQKLGLIAGMIRDGKLAWRLLNDPRVATLAKVMVPVLAVVYLLSPIDLLPDVIPVVGQLDDLAVLGLALRLFISLAPPAIVAEHRADMSGQAAQVPSGQAPRNTGAKEGEVVDADYRVIR